jgi:hypothetical protein
MIQTSFVLAKADVGLFRAEEPISSNNELPYYDRDHNRQADAVNDSPSLEELIVHVHKGWFSLLNQHPFSVRFCQSITHAVAGAPSRRRRLGLRTRDGSVDHCWLKTTKLAEGGHRFPMGTFISLEGSCPAL